MKNILRKYTKKTKLIIRTLSRKFGYDIIQFQPQLVGIDPYLDMKKFVTSDTPVLFDVGANYGQTIDEFKSVFKNPKINCFEPSPSAFEILNKKTSNMENVSVWNYGIGSSTTSLLLNENTHQNMSSFLDIGKEGWGSITQTTSVPITTIDQLCIEQNIVKIDVLKIDTQGFELEVFKGAKKSMQENKIGLLYFEVTFIDMYKDLPPFGELYDFAIDNGFELITIYPIKYKNNMAGWTDLLFKHKNYNPV